MYDKENSKNLAPLKAREGACVVGLFDDDDLELDELLDAVKKYPPCVAELNEGNVQAIFNRCLAKDGTPKKNVSRSILFSRTLGYKPEDEVVFYFDKGRLLDNRKNIEYLFGQLKNAHEKNEYMRMEDAFCQYQGRKWTDNRAHMLELLYLGCTMETVLISPFDAKTDATSLAVERLKPTLSPKDPAFQAWWEAHRAEWEA